MVSKRTFRFTVLRKQPLCRSRIQRSDIPVGESRKTSHEYSKRLGAYTETSPAETSPAVRKVIDLASRIASMSDHQVRGRYHELVDKRPELNALERFELGRIEARLDAEDRDPLLEARERRWQQDRTELLSSVEELLTRLRNLSL
jgi:hypothetical protein